MSNDLLSLRDVDFFYDYDTYPSMQEVLIEEDESNSDLVFSMPHFRALEAEFDLNLLNNTIT